MQLLSSSCDLGGVVFSPRWHLPQKRVECAPLASNLANFLCSAVVTFRRFQLASVWQNSQLWVLKVVAPCALAPSSDDASCTLAPRPWQVSQVSCASGLKGCLGRWQALHWT